MTELYLNGKFLGYVENYEEFVKQIKTERRKGTLDKNVNISYDADIDEIHIESQGGKLADF